MVSHKIGIKEVHEVLFSLLEVVDEVCNILNIPYWLDGGTLLGAVRSGGFIPWDDDIDVALLAHDVPKFLEYIRVNIKRWPSLILYDDYKEDCFWSSYLGDTRILQSGILPVKIDITYIKSLDFDLENTQLDKAYVNTARYFIKGKAKKEEYLFYGDLKKFESKRLEFSTKIEFFKDFKNYVFGNSSISESSEYNYSFNDMIVKKDRENYPHNVIFPLKKIELCAKSFSCPQNLNSYLSSLYGDNFMVPPPLEMRKPSANFYTYNKSSKKEIEIFVELYFKREARKFVARAQNQPLYRYTHKFISFLGISGQILGKLNFRWLIKFYKSYK